MRASSQQGVLAESEGNLSLERSHGLLTEKRRRYIMRYLEGETTPISIADLAKQIADAESGELSTAPSDLQDTVYALLYQRHIPKLANADVVVHNQDRNTVEPGDNFACVMLILNAVSDALDSDGK